ncbi:type VII toxin-antitoxin system MntA family adenylyltransferase antitoxin [Ectothiorhodospira lacustris]|uniref:type VII toxin-antitoxin system MntA family adenylyltransferase antitoxin n=1 Tax=Ectothiorhodospira lacustris TaxID=2899127 RepID=UPI001EE8286C|nr:nucleotidyltransferase domain-containing protein [Ectothiorhodospira lacustris]
MRTTLERLTEMASADREIAVLWLYGSRAKNTATETSDYDLAVAFRTPEKRPLERRLRPELLAQQWRHQLDLAEDMLSVVDINQAPIPLAMVIIRTGRVLQGNDPLRLAREENRISSMWELDYQFHVRKFASPDTQEPDCGNRVHERHAGASGHSD